MRDTIDEVIQIQMIKANFNNIELVSNFLGFENGDYFICTDELRLKQVILNYQSNALKFSRPGGKVIIHCIKTEGAIEIIVEDNGLGIKQEDLGKLFKLFGYLDRT